MKQSVWIGLLQEDAFLKRKTVNKTLCLGFSTVNTDRPIITYSRNSNNERNKERSFLSINEYSNDFESVKVPRLQNPKNVMICRLNVNSLIPEFSIKTRKWLCIGLSKPPSQNDK